MAWFGQNFQLSSKVSCVLSAIAAGAGLMATGMLVSFQYDLGELRKRAATVNQELFSVSEQRILGLGPWPHPYGRGWHVVGALILVCLGGALLVILAVNLPPRLRP
jgi:hypothetical protein